MDDLSTLMATSEERREFVRRYRTCVFAFNRKQGPPSMSIVYYVCEGDDILIATMAARAKAKAVARLGESSLCVLDEKWPMTYMQVLGPTVVDRNFDKTVEVMKKVGEIMSGNPIPDEARPVIEDMARREDRVLLRMKPEWTVYTPPVHLHAGDDASNLRHGLADRLPWR